MTSPFWYFLGAIGLAVIYDKYATPDDKANWENRVKMHHGEVGLLAFLVGMLTDSPRLTAVGAALALHDINDANKWFTGDTQQYHF
jgi:hypothetical protein